MVFRLQRCRDETLHKIAQITVMGQAPIYLHYHTAKKSGSC